MKQSSALVSTVPLLGTWKVARLDRNHFLGVVRDIEEVWHAIAVTPRWRLTHIRERTEQEAAHAAYVGMNRFLDLGGEIGLLPEEDRLLWTEEETPPGSFWISRDRPTQIWPSEIVFRHLAAGLTVARRRSSWAIQKRGV